MLTARANRLTSLPARLADRLRWEYREWRRPSRPSFQHEELDHALLDLIAWHAGERVLDVGCATGQYLKALARRGVDIHGLDIARASLLQARTTGRPLVAASGEQIPFCDESFDAVLTHKTMHLFRAPAGALAEFRRILRPGGRLVFSTSRIHTPYALAQAVAVRRLGAARWTWRNRISPSRWLRLAREGGFEVSRVYSCNLVLPIVFRVCDTWLVPNEWMRRYARSVRRISRIPVAGSSPRLVAQDFVIELRKL